MSKYKTRQLIEDLRDVPDMDDRWELIKMYFHNRVTCYIKGHSWKTYHRDMFGGDIPPTFRSCTRCMAEEDC